MEIDQHRVRMVRLSEAELKEIVEGNSWRYYFVMVVVFAVCAIAAIILSLYLAQLLSSSKI